jgi:predicted Zn-dependent protease
MRIPLAAIAIVAALGSAVSYGAHSTPRERPSSVVITKPRMNLFSVQQDIELGRLAAASREQSLELLSDTAIDRYLGKILRRLMVAAPGPRYPYQIKTVNAAEINAFSFPGGQIYVSRGLIEAARSETELAGVLAHEMSHVALRHATVRASNALVANVGAGIWRSLLGQKTNGPAPTLSALETSALTANFLTFDGANEYEADAVGAETMARAGYDPDGLADFFAMLRAAAQRQPGPRDLWAGGDVPATAREQRVRELARSLWTLQVHEVGGFAQVRAEIGAAATVK